MTGVQTCALPIWAMGNQFAMTLSSPPAAWMAKANPFPLIIHQKLTPTLRQLTEGITPTNASQV